MKRPTRAYADLPFGQIHYRRVEGEEPPVVLLHRTPVDSASFDGVLGCLSGRRAALALDTPGFGQSFRPTGSPGTADYARWFLAALDALGVGPFHLFAHHTGTHFAAEMATIAPDRVQTLMLSGVLYADAEERTALRRQIGAAPAVDADGAHLIAVWNIVRGLFAPGDLTLINTEALGVGGHMAVIGGLAGFGGDLSVTGLIIGAQRLTAVTVGSRAEHLAMTAFVEKHAIAPQIDKVFDVEAVEEAYAHSGGGAFGKVVVRL